uniref:Uncharacterized protein n=1 Tax=Nelumbo nucifera TaxID=4432 RepID=A0A822ZMY9_NELNU|nr:TPA_asm: hypothetical protein HUJ06_004373 [Nelumbo nucifera]
MEDDKNCISLSSSMAIRKDSSCTLYWVKVQSPSDQPNPRYSRLNDEQKVVFDDSGWINCEENEEEDSCSEDESSIGSVEGTVQMLMDLEDDFHLLGLFDADRVSCTRLSEEEVARTFCQTMKEMEAKKKKSIAPDKDTEVQLREYKIKESTDQIIQGLHQNQREVTLTCQWQKQEVRRSDK